MSDLDTQRQQDWNLIDELIIKCICAERHLIEIKRLLRDWERLSADLKPQTQEALFALNELKTETGKVLRTD
ncbi:MAG: hypothetical protein ACRDFB_10270 [Rhabdochlamydiaceae bacterium]